ncbi:parallel beta-helix domain-containing protein [Phenylobacterium montanum]|uniref:Right-handed parallel beta-helix repeat-containing protein n=1 Tax=Phenylobacterium montanum TaxID=2823693 RepID=A0A975G4E4_9CAUL|nr:parallel beta-helix domain-containing protein [Caulobacter sp. S6]QUD90441.1 right-handed parallel beta-helix repeat-containing protein [Caulobacter sp. S6]
MFRTSILFALVGAALSGPALAKTLDVAAGPDAQERIQSALIDAKPGDVVRLGAGRFDLADGLSLDVANVTVTGAGADKTILAFDAQKGSAEGLLVTSNGVTVRDLAVQNAHGNGVKAKGVDRITMKNLIVEWTGGPKSSNGAYGVYPVSSTNVLIDHVLVRGASDAGIYVGQSRNVVVEHSRAEFNVAGIEIENCYDAEVRDNLATHNAGGILVFDLPGLPQMGGHSTKVFNNASIDNDTPNFAPKGNIVAGVPTGTGVMVMANRDIHVFANNIDGNATVGVLLVAYVQPFTDPAYNPLPREISIHGNRMGKNGWAPAFPGGAELAKALGGTLPPVVWDGVVTYTHPGGNPETIPAQFHIADGPVANLRLVTQGTPITSANPEVTPNLGSAPLPEPAPVTLPAGQGG